MPASCARAGRHGGVSSKTNQKTEGQPPVRPPRAEHRRLAHSLPWRFETRLARTGPPLPETLCLLAPLAPTLKTLGLGGNKLGGTITDDIAAFTKLTELWLGAMGLEGAWYDQTYPHENETERGVRLPSQSRGKSSKSCCPTAAESTSEQIQSRRNQDTWPMATATGTKQGAELPRFSVVLRYFHRAVGWASWGSASRRGVVSVA